MMKKQFFLFLLLFLPFLVLANDNTASEKKMVVCVHGLFRSSKSMWRMARSLKKEGRKVLNWDYPSRKKLICAHGEDLAKELLSISLKHPGITFDFVTHSLGGLVLRSALNHPLCPRAAKVGKVVLLAPPNRGAFFGRKLAQNRLVQKIVGSYAGNELLTTPENGFDSLGNFPEAMKVLVIAGSVRYNPTLRCQNDGTVMVQETALKTPYRLQLVPVMHSWMPMSSTVITMTRDFILGRVKK
jgi:pimeloyl-ACP methyl ester carboxylesterase